MKFDRLYAECPDKAERKLKRLIKPSAPGLAPMMYRHDNGQMLAGGDVLEAAIDASIARDQAKTCWDAGQQSIRARQCKHILAQAAFQHMNVERKTGSKLITAESLQKALACLNGNKRCRGLPYNVYKSGSPIMER